MCKLLKNKKGHSDGLYSVGIQSAEVNTFIILFAMIYINFPVKQKPIISQRRCQDVV